MKIILEAAQLQEPEVIIQGVIGSPEVTAILQALQQIGGRKTSSKLMVYRDEEHYIVDVSEVVFLETGDNNNFIRVIEHCASPFSRG